MSHANDNRKLSTPRIVLDLRLLLIIERERKIIIWIGCTDHVGALANPTENPPDATVEPRDGNVAAGSHGPILILIFIPHVH